MTEKQKRLARLEQKWAKLPKDLVDRFTASLVGSFTRVMEGDRPRREYVAKARASGNTRAAEIAEGLAKHDYYDAALPEDMPEYVKQLKPIPRPRKRPNEWTEDHFKKLDGLDEKMRADAIASIVAALCPNLTRLEAKGLVAEGQERLVGIETQVQLLGRYWEHRVEALGMSARTVLRELIGRMVEDRTLQAPVGIFDAAASAVLETLSRNGIVTTIDGDRLIQFRHHLLFDYAASRVYLGPDALLTRPGPFAKEDAPGLMLAPAVTFLLHELWSEAPDRGRFWSAVSNLATDPEADPVIRSVAGRAGVSHPVAADDVEALAERVQTADDQALEVLGQLVGALNVRLDDDTTAPLAPWSRLAARLAEVASRARHPLHGLVFLLTSRVHDPLERAETGLAARALLAQALDAGHPASGAVSFVAETFDTDPGASKSLLRRLSGQRHNLIQRLLHERVLSNTITRSQQFDAVAMWCLR